MSPTFIILFGYICVFWLVFSQCHRVFRYFEALAERLCGKMLNRCEEVVLPADHFRLLIQVWLIFVPGIVIYVGFIQQQIPFAILAGMLGAVGPRILLKMSIENQEKAIRHQMVSASNFLVNTSRAGMPITKGLSHAVLELPAPVSQLFERIVSDHQNGRVLVEAIDGVKKRLSMECFTLFATAVQVSLSQGGNMTQSLNRITHSLEEHDRLEGKLMADTAESRRSNLLMACMPVAWFGIYYFFDYENLSQPMFTGFWGPVTTTTVFLLAFVGYRYAENILKLEV